MESLRQLLDMSVMKQALETLKEEVERLETSDFNVLEYEKQIPRDNTGQNEYESELNAEGENYASAAAATELVAGEAFKADTEMVANEFKADKEEVAKRFKAYAEMEAKRKEREAEIEQNARDAATAAEEETKLAEQKALETAAAAKREKEK